MLMRDGTIRSTSEVDAGKEQLCHRTFLLNYVWKRKYLRFVFMRSVCGRNKQGLLDFARMLYMVLICLF